MATTSLRSEAKTCLPWKASPPLAPSEAARVPEKSSLVQAGRRTLKWPAKGLFRRSRDHSPSRRDRRRVEAEAPEEEEEHPEGSPAHLRAHSSAVEHGDEPEDGSCGR